MGRNEEIEEIKHGTVQLKLPGYSRPSSDPARTKRFIQFKSKPPPLLEKAQGAMPEDPLGTKILAAGVPWVLKSIKLDEDLTHLQAMGHERSRSGGRRYFGGGRLAVLASQCGTAGTSRSSSSSQKGKYSGPSHVTPPGGCEILF
jgi:hypothetical protein